MTARRQGNLQMGKPEDEEQHEKREKKVVVRIPSHQEVLEKSAPQPPASLFRPSTSAEPTPSSFTQAFAFVKNTEFYTPPPRPPPPPPPSVPPAAPGTTANIPEKIEAVAVPQARNAIIVSRRQQGNPILKHIRNARWTYADIVPDYLLGQNTCALYISLRYHLLHPDYIYYRIRELQKSFKLRIVLCHVDVEDVIKPLHEVTRTALLHDCTLLCGWSGEECARYLETIKIYENKPADSIQERTDNDYLSRLTSALTTVRRVNKTDVVTLGSAFGTLAGIMGSSMEEMARCPGIGERKVKRLYDAFHEPFRKVTKHSSSGIRSEVATQGKAENTGTEETSEARGDRIDDFGEAKYSELSVRSALTAAHAKYGSLFGTQKDKDYKVDGVSGGGAASETSLGNTPEERVNL